MVYRAFSAVVADNQFANLGLMLVGTLARAQKVLKALRKEVEGERDAEPESNDTLIGYGDLDFGEVIKREEAEMDGVAVAEENEQPTFEKQKKQSRGIETDETNDEIEKEPVPVKQRKKRKKRGGDELDALFGTLT